jgi:hypothetical protein
MINYSWIIKLEIRSDNVTEFITNLKLQIILIIGKNFSEISVIINSFNWYGGGVTLYERSGSLSIFDILEKWVFKISALS